jgi:amidase
LGRFADVRPRIGFLLFGLLQPFAEITMNRARRHLLALSAMLGATQGALAKGDKMPASSPALPGHADAASVLAALAAGHTSALALTHQALARIRAVDRRGPNLGAMIELNPEAETIARALDAERKQGRVRGPLHGLPVVIKDNLATADRMKTTAGSLALAAHPAKADSTLVRRLRDAGLVIVGKTNLSEWANFRSSRSLSGWSGRGGLTRNPYALDRNTSGSSSGSAVAVAADYVPFSIGTETDGSIVSPAQINGIVGLKPTLGLLSRHGIIPIAASQDTAGPMARTVRDAALLLQVLAGPDPADPATSAAPAIPDYLAGLSTDGLKGTRIGVVRSQFGNNPLVTERVEAALRVMAAQGAIIVDPVTLPAPDSYGDAETEVLLHEFKVGMAEYLAKFAPDSGFRTLADLAEWNRQHAAQELGFFGQDQFDKAIATEGLQTAKYLEARAKCVQLARTEGIEKTLAEHQLDALLAPTGDPSWTSDFVNGDHFGASFSTPAAVAGLPHLTVPCGLVFGLPVSVSLVGAAWSEAKLLLMGYAYEQASQERRAPKYLATLPLPAAR